MADLEAIIDAAVSAAEASYDHGSHYECCHSPAAFASAVEAGVRSALAPAVTRDDAATCVAVARALAAGLGLDWDTYTSIEQAVTVALASQVFHAIDMAGYDIHPKTKGADHG